MISRKTKLRICFSIIMVVTLLVVGVYSYKDAAVEEWGQGTLITIVPWIH